MSSRSRCSTWFALEAAAAFRHHQGTPALHPGREGINFFLGASLLVALGAFWSATALELWVLRRVQRLNREVAEVEHNAHSIRLSDFGNDELGQLAGEMNQMLERLEHSRRATRRSSRSMRDGYFEMDVDGVILTVNPRSANCSVRRAKR